MTLEPVRAQQVERAKREILRAHLVNHNNIPTGYEFRFDAKTSPGRLLRKDSGIIWEPTAPYTPEQNGLSEVQNRIVMNGVRAMLFDSQFYRFLWSEILHTKVYQKNRSRTTRLRGITPHEAWTGEQPFLGHMRIIGCVAWVHIPKEERKKLDERSKKCYLLGYEGTNVFRVWNPATPKVKRASHVGFDESRMMTSAVSDTGYWLAEATGDNATDVFEAGGKAIEHPHTSNDVVNSYDSHDSPPNIEYIRNILNNPQNPTREPGDVGEDSVDIGVFDDNDIEEIPPDSPEAHPDPSTDATYTSLPKRIPKPSQKPQATIGTPHILQLLASNAISKATARARLNLDKQKAKD